MEKKLQRTKNYLFQNYDYVKNPVNFKHVVIDLLRRYGLFIHMRDEPNCIYDLDRFLYEKNPMGIPYHKENIIELKKRIKDAENKINQLNTDGDELYQKYCEEGLKDYNDIILPNIYFKEYKEEAGRYEKRVKDIQDFLNNFKLKNQEFNNLIRENLSDCIEALVEDCAFYNREAAEHNVGDTPEPYNPTPKEQWIQEEIKKCHEEIEWCTKQIKEEKKAIKNLQEKDALIKEIFTALEPFDKEIE